MYDFISKKQVASKKVAKLLHRTTNTFMAGIIFTVPKRVLNHAHLIIKLID